MNGTTHLLIGAGVGLGASYIATEPLPDEAVFLAASLFGSLLPDADHPDAMIFHRFKAEREGLGWYVLGTILRAPFLAIARFLPHRGPVTHGPFVAAWLVPILLVTGALLTRESLALIAAVGVSAGYVLHLAADGVTPHGLPGWPFCERVHLLPRPLRPRTGGLFERVFAVTLLLGEAYIAFLLVSTGT